MHRPLPYVFEDRTGANSSSDFDEIYDRSYFHIGRTPQTGRTKTMIYCMHTRATRHRDSQPLTKPASAILDYGEDESLGLISYVLPTGVVTEVMSKYLRKTSMFSGSLSRKFTASDGREYRWSYRTVPGQEWTCSVGPENFVVAHYDLKPPDVRAYGVSGHTLTVDERCGHILLELLASLNIMRHIALHNL
ncbi:hypothetical protein CYLTODRAFT_495283 [Cylindrobasidium torrendii FP15055 ss-10]|uniref:DUF6593 domain-containing protein n=1 Tax=Cylindrobasidium torrendii FP15055 ss-10 TaxID=1314674 RepID=A0A0D7AVS5_9AGAR|nr:hypothetical protein CYLTODRAFT_495283 [Cylindrobasidium torrendii FP15055 ss-10]